ncbi:hypothetical protein CCAX7_003080 [Capsulimonas corticalis]|uniref:Arabinogalactan endo-beta-1,4-galactanase n=1 Tax=Capsulimonas corticalis TaxID=2219043 RepID=A0A402CS54_9BACT|nr:RICIN domain-containing protein [Capsulimonas corticalis]BDI28257.1 hypothetical protein CCAX7_003080 [Capsulimonas corticalis]
MRTKSNWIGGAAVLLALIALPAARAVAQDFNPAPTTRKFPYVGGDYGWQERFERIPSRQFLDFNGQPTDAVRLMGNCGLNAVRVFVSYGQAFTTPSVDNTNVNQRERSYGLDYGGVDLQVDAARRARANGQKVILTITLGQSKDVAGNEGQFIPDSWLNDTYTQTLTAIDTAVRQMLDPFLYAGIQPDIIIIGNEDEAGQLFEVVGPNNTEAERDQANTNPYDNTATGIYRIWPKCTGYWKQEILSAKDEITKAGYDNSTTRFSVHTTSNGWRARGLFDEIFNNAHADAEQTYYDPVTSAKGSAMTIIPDNIRNTNLRDILDILGFSYYPTTPTDGAQANYDAQLNGSNGGMDFTDDMAYFNTIIPNYGRYASGPFQGQYKKQALVVEYATAGGGSAAFSLSRQNAFTTYFFNKCAQYEWMDGAMWWEPTYANSNFLGGFGSLFRVGAFNATLNEYPTFSPISTLKTWGSFAASDPKSQYLLTNRGGGSILDVYQHSSYGGAWTQMAGATSTPTLSPLWQILSNADGTFRVVNGNTGQALKSWSSTAADHITPWTLDNPIGTNEEWSLTPTGDGYQFFASASSGQALDVAGGWGVQNPKNAASQTQQWQVTPIPKFRLVNRAGGIMDVYQQSKWGGSWGQIAAADNVSFSVSQEWRLISDDNGYYRIVNANTGYVLQTGTSTVGDPAYQWPAASPITTNQEWSETVLTGGYVHFVNRNTGLALDVNTQGFTVQNTVSASSQTQQWTVAAAP